MKILVSACLLGLPCRYDGQAKPCEKLIAAAKTHDFVPVCPEQLGGLPTPRPPAERQGDCVRARTGEDVTAAYARGAACAVRLYEMNGCDCAILKARSPSCGRGAIYDGTFSGALRPGDGMAAEALLRRGCPVYTEDEIDSILI